MASEELPSSLRGSGSGLCFELLLGLAVFTYPHTLLIVLPTVYRVALFFLIAALFSICVDERCLTRPPGKEAGVDSHLPHLKTLQ